MSKLTLTLHAAVVLLSLGGCESPGGEDRRAATSVDSWASTDGSWIGFDEGKTLEQARLHIVPYALESKAEPLLSNVSCLELSPKQVEELLGHPVPEVPGTRLYLTRGVYLSRVGHFSVMTIGDKLLVHHGCLGHYAAPMKRQCLVLQLETMPKEVYVSCSMAE